MRRPSIAIVGCGFIGSHLAEEIAKLLYSQDLFPYNLIFIDYDTWEESNSANQNVPYSVAISEELKAITCAKMANEYPNNEAVAITEKLTARNGAELLKDTVLVIDAVDNIPTRQLLWGLAKGGVTGPCMHVGISRKGDGIINWSAPNFDTFPFDPGSVAGRNLAEQDFKEPPCEMYKYRASGTVLFQATAKAVAFFLAKDPWDHLQAGGAIEKGTMTCWNTSIENGAQVQVDDMFLDRETEFFPTCWKEVNLD
jgi:hypothetical protein